ncbi:uncharacterized protein LOC102714342 [Oryza brachyantha]|uniref:uncharacterized protein LOC102714342 n=1 Tax=Oryza brachyantha TaxID=4533 RepID=UPI001ADD277A|nr:uncharacterized protein LOC102714342 [Oryza brachyantha]
MAGPATWGLLLLLGVALLVSPALAAGGNGSGNNHGNNGNNGDNGNNGNNGDNGNNGNSGGGGKHGKSPPPPYHDSPPPPPPHHDSPPPPVYSPPPPVVPSPPPPVPSSPPPPVVPSPPPPVPSSPPPPVVPSPPPPVPSSPPPPVVPVPSPPPPVVPVASPPPPVASPPPPVVPVASPPPPANVYCTNTTRYPTCTAPAYCPKRCPQSCHMDCATCKPICDCNLPGAVCQDPRFIGGDGNTFYFHGRRDRDFCLLSDANLHINAHFIGNHVPGLKRDPTWVQAIAVLFSGHRLYVGARKTAVWDDESDRLAVVFDGEPVQVQPVANARWEWGSLSVTRTKAANGVLVELDGVFKITANAVPITKEDSRIHRYGVTDDDCLAHLDLAFKFYSLTDDVHGVLGQTYRSSYVNRLDVTAKMPVMGGEKQFTSSALFAADCAVARFGRAGGDADAVAIAADELIDVKCSTGLDGVGVVCKK